jgi:membrane-associated PAP2 superfamily phosphatase
VSPSSGVELFAAGAMSAGYVIAGLFFLRFWVRTRDTLFAAFAVAFTLMALNQAVAAFERHDHAENSAAYLLRLAAFVLILLAVLGKNRGTPPEV